MSHILLILLVLFDGIGSLGKIARENALKKEAEEAFMNRDYRMAIAKYSYLTDTLKVVDDKATLNLGHSYFKANDLITAAKTYEKLYTSADKNVKSVAAQQLGVLSYKADQDKEKALTYFKESLRANPNNTESRYNYEFLKKIIEGKKDPKMDDKNKKDDKKDESKKEDKKEGDKQEDKKDGDKKEDDKKSGDKKDDAKDGKDGKDKNDDPKDGKDGKDSKDKTDGKGKDGDKKDDQPKDKKDGKGEKSDKQDDKKNGGEKDGDTDDKKEDANAKEDKKGESALGKDDKKQGKEGQQGKAMKEQQGGKQDKEKMVANPEVLAKMGITDARAKMILDAMKGSEIQYIQQVKRESTKKNKKGKPDW